MTNKILTERFGLFESISGIGLRPEKDGEFVRYSDYAALEARCAKIDAHRRKVIGENERLLLAFIKHERELATLRDRIEREPVVKALEWSEYRALGNSFKTLARDCFGNEFRRFDTRLKDLPQAEIDAAQADYERRIRSTLASAPERVEAEPVAWVPVADYEGLYEISSAGDLRNVRTGKVQAKNLAGLGYVKADLWKDNQRKQTTIHRLVAQAFVPNPEGKPEVNHINGDKQDNRAANLEWSTRSENQNHSFYVLGSRVNAVEAHNPDTGEKRHYRSVCEAERDGFHSAHIYRALRVPSRRVKGFHFTEIASPPAPVVTEAATKLVKMRKGIEADVSSAHSNRGNGASEWMREDDRDFRRDLRLAFDGLESALASRERQYE